MKSATTRDQSSQEIQEPSRRTFLRGSGLVAGAVVTGTTLATFAAHSARAQGNFNGHFDHGDDHGYDGWRSEYGEVRPTPDQSGNNILALPRGFQYVTFSAIGDRMSDGNIVPRAHDGMTCLEWRGSTVRLIRNHE